MKQYTIGVKNEKQFEVVVGLMLASGLTFVTSRRDQTPEQYTQDVYPKYPKPYVDGTGKINATRNNYGSEYAWPKDATTIVNLLFAKTYEVENVGDYKATVTDKGIVVGCQTISFDKFQEIVNKVAEFKSDQ